MGKRGPAPAPKLQVVREGRKLRPERHEDQVVLPPIAPTEPAWTTVFPAVRGQLERPKRLRKWAAEEWARIVPPLNSRAILATVDHSVLLDHCTAWAELQECVRTISREGHIIDGAVGPTRHPATMTAAQLRTQLAKTTVQLGLTPAARARMTSPAGGSGDGEEDDPFD